VSRTEKSYWEEKSIFELHPEEARAFRQWLAENIAEQVQVAPLPENLKRDQAALHKAIYRSVEFKRYPEYLPSVATLFRISKFFHVAPHMLLRPRPKVSGSERRVREAPASEMVRKRTRNRTQG
jgi:hypothetical protein